MGKILDLATKTPEWFRAWLRETPAGQRELYEAERLERILEQRRRDAEALAQMTREREERLSAMAAEQKRRLEETIAGILAAHTEAIKQQRDVAEFDHRTAAKVATLRKRLHDTADPRVREQGPVIEELATFLRHVIPHGLSNLEQWRQRARDMRRFGITTKDHGEQGKVLSDTEATVALAEACVPLEQVLRAAQDAVRALAYTGSVDVTEALGEIAATLPARCPCGYPFKSVAMPATGREVAA